MRKSKTRFEDLPFSSEIESKVAYLCRTFSNQVFKEELKKRYLPATTVLKLTGTGLFIAGAMVFPNLPKALSPLIKDWENEEREAWKRFNIPHLKRTLTRLEKQKLVEIKESEGKQIIQITEAGMKRVLKLSLDEIEIKKPRFWDNCWRLVSYDIPGEFKSAREFFRDYLGYWGFYPLHESVFLHAYPCENEVIFLREYLGIGQFVRLFQVSRIENDEPFKKYFGLS